VCYNILDCKWHRILFTVKEHEIVVVYWTDFTSWQYYINICNMHGLESCSLSVYDIMGECGWKYTLLAVRKIGVLHFFFLRGWGWWCVALSRFHIRVIISLIRTWISLYFYHRKNIKGYSFANICSKSNYVSELEMKLRNK
jgi:hypothetical protein